MRGTRIAVTVFTALFLSACSSFSSFLDKFGSDDASPAPVSSSKDEAPALGQVVYIGNVPPPVNDLDKSPSGQLLDVRMDNGDLRTVIQDPIGVRVGDRVRVAEGRAYRS
jgi:hypothetical protein